KLHGAEIDLIARAKRDPFSAPIYIEVTIENVDNEKYGKDLTKFALIREKQPDARCLIVSSSGFTLPVLERAKETRIEALTYEQLFAKFERFDKYVTSILDASDLALELKNLDAIYEEPDLFDQYGTHKATTFLTKWRSSQERGNRWLILVGEYG